jgi:predicted DNA binding CopG/RHH family protein
MSRGKYRKEDVRKMGDVFLDEKTSRMIEKKIAQAEKELYKEVKISFSWGNVELRLIQGIAQKLGVPYQTYIKQVLYRQAMQDLKSFKDSELSS